MASGPPSGSPPSPQGVSAEFAARVPKLLAAMRSVGGGLELHSTLERICETAADLADACHAAIGVVAEDGEGLADFVYRGVDEETARRIGHLPDGHGGLLGALLRDAGTIRLEDLTADARAYGFPAHHPPMRGFLGVPIRVRGQIFGNLYLTDKRGGAPFTDDDLTMVRLLAVEAGIAVGNARLYEAAQQRERWIDGSVAVTTALLAGDGGGDALHVVAEQARRLSRAAAGIVLLPASGGGLEIAAVASEGPTEALGTVLPPDGGAVTALLRGRAVVLDDAATDPLLVTGLARAYGPAMLLPLGGEGRVRGALVTLRARGRRPFSRAERALAVRFAEQAALALMAAEAQRDRERLAVYEDRDRIARDLHDVVVRRLFATGMLLERARHRSTAPEVRDGVGRAVGELDVTIQEIRAAVFAQREPTGEEAGLRGRVLHEIATAAVPLGFTPSCRFLGPVDSAVGEATRVNLLAALREALSNAVRHAEASRVEVVVDATVSLRGGRPGVRLTVADDGVGIPAGGRRSGLANLRRRAESLGGTSRHGPGIGAGGGGTTVLWEAPY